MNKTIGQRIKQIRELRKIELSDLSERIGLTVKQLSEIEGDKQIPSLGPLIRVARGLGVRLGTFTDDQEQLGPVVTFAGKGEQGISFSSSSSNSNDHMDFFSLAQGKAGRHMEPFMVNLIPNQSQRIAPSSHEGEEFLYVISGEVVVTYGKDTFKLAMGDSIYYDSIIKHHVQAANNEPATVLAVVYVPL